MSRKIDAGQKSLSNADKQYLLQRPRLARELGYSADQLREDAGEDKFVGVDETRRSAEDLENEAQATGATTETPQAGGPAVGQDDSDGDYESWSKSELQDELEERGLSKSGKVDDLVARLREDDAEGE